MKKLFLLPLLSIYICSLSGQNTTTAIAKVLKSKKLIVALQEYDKNTTAEDKVKIDSANAALKEAMTKIWTFSEIEGFKPESEAATFTKQNKKTHCYIKITKGESRSPRHNTTPQNQRSASDMGFRYVSYADIIAIFDPAQAIQVLLPYYENYMDIGDISYAVMQMQKQLELLESGKMASIMKSGSYVKANAKNLAGKTLLIPKEYLDPELTKAKVEAIYKKPVEITSIENIKTKIIEKDPTHAFIMYTPVAVSGRVFNRLYVSSTADGDVFGVCDGNPIRLELGIFGSVGERDYLVDAKILKQIAGFVE